MFTFDHPFHSPRAYSASLRERLALFGGTTIIGKQDCFVLDEDLDLEKQSGVFLPISVCEPADLLSLEEQLEDYFFMPWEKKCARLTDDAFAPFSLPAPFERKWAMSRFNERYHMFQRELDRQVELKVKLVSWGADRGSDLHADCVNMIRFFKANLDLMYVRHDLAYAYAKMMIEKGTYNKDKYYGAVEGLDNIPFIDYYSFCSVIETL